MSDENVPAYIARCPKCNGIVMAAVDDGSDKQALAREVAQAISDGCAVERVTVGWVRSHANEWCMCDAEDDKPDKPDEDQPSLFPPQLAFA